MKGKIAILLASSDDYSRERPLTRGPRRTVDGEYVVGFRLECVRYTLPLVGFRLRLFCGRSLSHRQSFAILTRTSNGWMYVNVFIVVYVHEMDTKRRIHSCNGCASRKFQNFAIFGAKHPLVLMAFKHFTPNFERA